MLGKQRQVGEQVGHEDGIASNVFGGRCVHVVFESQDVFEIPQNIDDGLILQYLVIYLLVALRNTLFAVLESRQLIAEIADFVLNLSAFVLVLQILGLDYGEAIELLAEFSLSLPLQQHLLPELSDQISKAA